MKSLTGQITTDITHGIYRVDTPRFQSVDGFLGAAGEQSLSDLAVSCQNPFASVAAISLDGKPLAESGHVLIQVGTEEHPTDWKERPMEAKLGDGKFTAFRILDTGHGPWQIAKAHLIVRVRNLTAKSVQALDPNGMPMGTVPMKRDGEWVSFEFPADALYVAVE